MDKELVSGGGKKISVISDSPLEAQGFILSHLLQNDFARKAILVKDLDAWEAIISSGEEGLIIVLDHSFMPASVGLAVNKGHLLLVPSPKTGLPIKFDASIELGRMSWESRESALSEIVPKDMAAQIMADTKGYFLPVLRHKALNGNLVLPAPWSTEDPVALLILLFIPAWEEKTANRLPWHDTELIAEVSGISYEDFQEILERLSRSVDAPVRLVGNVWQLISKTDYWAFVE
ncbi:MAG TPA: hypothetical protein PK765_05365 [bacterium]|nr:hypothetical protein [bacterium]